MGGRWIAEVVSPLVMASAERSFSGSQSMIKWFSHSVFRRIPPNSISNLIEVEVRDSKYLELA